jgi:sec-independent protein translocase protein TatB
MIDFGFDKLALIGAVALIVIGPERLPRVARVAGVLLGKAQRYMSQVQAEVKQTMEMDELRKMKDGLQEAAGNLQQQVQGHLDDAQQQLNSVADNAWQTPADTTDSGDAPYISYHDPIRKNWRLRRAAMPMWYKQQHGLRRHVQSGAARVARFRPPGLHR